MSKYLRLGIVATIAVCGVLLFLLVSASENTAFFEKYYPILIFVNAAIALLFLILVIYLFARLIKRARQKKFGIKILSKFVLALVLSGVIPGILIYLVSAQFLSKSVDSWFDVRVERALDSGLTLGREILGAYQEKVLSQAKQMATEVADTLPPNRVATLDSLREREQLDEVLLLSANGQIYGISGTNLTTLVPELPTNTQLQAARSHGYWQSIDERDGGDMRAVALVPLPEVASIGLGEPLSNLIQNGTTPASSFGQSPLSTIRGNREQLFLKVVGAVPLSLAANAEALMGGYRDYQEMILARDGLRSIYQITLTLTLLLSMFGAIALSVMLATNMTNPLFRLVEGTRRVGEGKYDRVPEYAGDDEVGVLTHSFNDMICQLAEARNSLERRGLELEQAKTFMERILSRMTAGVIVLSESGQIVLSNASASRILGIDLEGRKGAYLQEVVLQLSELVEDNSLQAEEEEIDISEQIELVREKDGARLILYVRGTTLPFEGKSGYLLVFDNITKIISAQRSEAWGEVARRLAHEIKNPLTPIQLAAERMQMKFSSKLSSSDSEVLARATKTIVSQVTAMKQMVDDFRSYAKSTNPKLEPVDLNVLLEELSILYGEAGTYLELDLDKCAPRIEADANQLRQIIHNLLSNAIEASTTSVIKEIKLRTETVFHKAHPDKVAGVKLIVTDNGTGFSPEILARVFEPYVTTKPSGTGLGLAMIKKIVDEHGATVDVVNRTRAGSDQVIGAKVSIIFRRFV